MGDSLLWNRQWKREKTLHMCRGSGGWTHTAKRVMGDSKECLQWTQMVGEQWE